MGINETPTVTTDHLGARRVNELVGPKVSETPRDVEVIPKAGAPTQLGKRALRLVTRLHPRGTDTILIDSSGIDSELPQSDEGDDGDDGDFDELLRDVTLTSDPMKDYLRKISKTSLLTASQEVDLGKAIEAGVFAQAGCRWRDCAR